MLRQLALPDAQPRLPVVQVIRHVQLRFEKDYRTCVQCIAAGVLIKTKRHLQSHLDAGQESFGGRIS